MLTSGIFSFLFHLCLVMSHKVNMETSMHLMHSKYSDSITFSSYNCILFNNISAITKSLAVSAALNISTTWCCQHNDLLYGWKWPVMRNVIIGIQAKGFQTIESWVCFFFAWEMPKKKKKPREW